MTNGDTIDLDEAVRLELVGPPLSGGSALTRTARPTLSGLKWIAVPSNCVGLAYGVADATVVQAFSVSIDGGAKVVASVALEAPVVHLACSPDGRMVAVACTDGSLRCYDATSASLTHRWTIPDTHSHVVNDINVGASTTRDHAAAGAGPVRSLAFAPTGYGLLLADSGREVLRIYDAASANPRDMIRDQMADVPVASAAWSSQPKNSPQHHLAVGGSDGSIHIYMVDIEKATATKISLMPFPGEQDAKEAWSCTHLDWFDSGKFLAAGFCCVTPQEDEDDDDEDDPAGHEASMFIGKMDTEISTVSGWTELGDVAAFFSVPRNGRHIFFTSFVPTSQNASFLLVASNVATDVGIVCRENDGGSEWQVMELQEGAAATTPTDEDDEFTFPVGLSSVVAPSQEAGSSATAAQALLLGSTDGSLSTLKWSHQDHPDYFNVAQISPVVGLAALPDKPVEQVITAPPELQDEPTIPEYEEESHVELATTPAQPAQPAVFGSGSASGPSFGSSRPLSFASPAFGQPSPLGGSSSAATPAFGSAGPPAIGSGAAPPTFGSASTGGGFAALAASPAATSGSGFGTSTSSTSPFAGFGTGTGRSGSVPSSMVKPLFDSTATTTSDAGAVSSEKEEAVASATSSSQAEPTAGSKPARDTEPPLNKRGASAAAEAFDSFDTSETGRLPVSKFEDLLDGLGEGFHGGELEAQLALVDPLGSKQVERSAFISWYCNLLDGESSAQGDDDSKAERAEEREKAEKLFMPLATGEGNTCAILVSDFQPLIEAIGTTYCEEEHQRTVKKLSRSDGKIYWTDFIAWYINWLFGDESESEEEAHEDEGGPELPPAAGPSVGDGGWGSAFQMGKDSWKCESCMVRNTGNATVCAACETARPGHTAAASVDNGSGDAASGSRIGSGGFTLAAPAVASERTDSDLQKGKGDASSGSAITSGGFTFGAPAAAVSSERIKADKLKSADEASSGSCIGSSGFTFGAPASSTVSQGDKSGAERSDGDVAVRPPPEMQGEPKIPEAEGETHVEVAASPAPPAVFGSGSASGLSFGSSKPLSFASPAFGQPSPLGGSSSATTPAFGSAGPPAIVSGAAPPTFGSASTGGGFAALAASPAATSGSGFGTSTSSTSPFAGFGTGTGRSGSVPSSMVKPLFDSTATTTSDAGAVSSEKEEAVASATSSSQAEPTAGSKPARDTEPPLNKRGASAAAEAFDSFDTSETGRLPVSKFEDLLDGLGEGFHGGELEAQLALVDPLGSKQVERSAFISWYCNLLDGESSAQGDDDSKAERAEEREKAEKLFMPLATGEGNTCAILVSDFQPLIEAIGTTYCEEEHQRTVKKLSRSDGKIYWTDFIAWYINWLFGDESESEEEAHEDEGRAELPPAAGPSVGDGGWGSAFQMGKDSWKCESCMVRNTGNATVCAACETARPGHTAAASVDNGSGDAASGSRIGPGGFTFAAPAVASEGTESDLQKGKGDASSGSAITSGGFTFGAPAAAKTTPATSSGYPPISSKASSFGTPKSSSPAPSAANSAPASSSGYPPMSSKSPTPFGGDASKMATPAPTAAKTPPAASSGYPPMPSKGPTPFGGGAPAPSAAKTATAGSSGYPPMSSKGPTPFGGGAPAPSAAKTATAGSSGYPPMSSKAPTPFGDNASKMTTPAPSAAKSSPAACSKPSSSAPSAGKTTPAGSSGYPRMSSKAPTPFGRKTATSAPSAAKTTTAASSGYPPMSSKGPTPFGGGAPAPSAAKTTPAGSSGYPPMSAKTPTPFGGALKAPTVHFGGASTAAPDAPSAAKMKAPPSSGYPPIPSKAPTPFGGATSKVASVSQPDTRTGPGSFPPQSQPSPSPLAGGERRSTAAVQTYQASSDDEAQLWRIIEQFGSDLRRGNDPKPGSHSTQFVAFEKSIEDLVRERDEVKLSCDDLVMDHSRLRERAVFVLSRKADIERQETESRRLIDEQSNSSAEGSDLIKTQPLDAESEASRRRVAAKAVAVQKQIGGVGDKFSMMKRIVEVDTARYNAASKAGNMALFSALKNGFDRAGQLETDTAAKEKKALVVANPVSLTSPAETPRVMTRERATKSPLKGTGRRIEPLPVGFPSPRQRRDIHPIDSRAQKPRKNAERWGKVVASLHDLQTEIVPKKKVSLSSRMEAASRCSKTRVAVPNWRGSGRSQLLASKESDGETRVLGAGYSPSRQAPVMGGPLFSPPPLTSARSDWSTDVDFDQSRVKALSMSLPQKVKEISGSTAAREALSSFGTTPEKVGTDRETIKRGEDALVKTRARSTNLRPSTTGKNAEKIPSKSPVASSSAAFPPMAKQAPAPFSQIGGKSGLSAPTVSQKPKSVSAFPPMAKQAPTPFSQSKSTSTPSAKPLKLPATSTSTKSSKSTLSIGRPLTNNKDKEDTGQKTDSAAVEVSERLETSGFGSLKGLGDSLLGESETGSADLKGNNVSVTINSSKSIVGDDAFSSQTKKETEPDYHAILSKFYQQHNPSKLGDVDKHLQKYKGKEVELFGKLAKKYAVPNPLDATAAASAPSFGAGSLAASSPFGSAVVSSSTPMTTPASGQSQSPFGSPSRPAQPATSTTPLGLVANPPASPAPFGATTSPAIAPSPSPFGQPSAGTSVQPFGSATSGTSPFGQPVSAVGPPGTLFSSQPLASSPAVPPLGGRNPRDTLIAFYQKYNPSKLSEVDRLLTKYNNNEEQMFRNLAKKYNLDPAEFGLAPASAPAAFGTPPVGGMVSGGFGQPSPLGAKSTGAFGSASAPSGSPFGSASSGGFGQPAPLGSDVPGNTFGGSTAAGGHAFGSSSNVGGGFASFGSTSGGVSGFGSLAQGAPAPAFGAAPAANAGFGSTAPSPGFGSMSSGAPGGTFGGGGMGSAPFGAPRR